ncbi:MAG: 2Fe-2S iron-sulfur cluster-binding protein [Planctomycetes bacterium]|nr:2Fe-2S iron-sulfur cluster-binding protein [Planctomycetota bacterium]
MYNVTFLPSGTAISSSEPKTILHLVQEAGLELRTGCIVGFCGTDTVRIVEGLANVEEPSLTERETLYDLGVPENVRLACCAMVAGDCIIELPVKEEQSGIEKDIAPHYVKSTDKYRLLFVDLEADDLALLRRELAEHDCGIQIAVSGFEARKLLRFNEYQMIVLRTNGDDRDSGWVVLEHLKIYRTPSCVTVLYEKEEEPPAEFMTKFRATDMKVLHKPYSPAMLASIIALVFDKD